MVAARSRVFASDEELGKRDDDRKPGTMSHWNIKHKPAWRKRRIFLILLACAGAWLFIHYIPTDLGPVDRRTGMRLPHKPMRAPPAPEIRPFDDVRKPPESPPQQNQQPPPPPDDDGPGGPPPRDYDGPIRFYYLASTLRLAEREKDFASEDRDVVFAASNLNAASAILPMACEMASWRRNTVHIAIMGRSDLPLEEIQSINNTPRESCNIYWHDARADFLATSTDSRMEVSVAGALGHINNFVHPVVVITADLASEDIFFAQGLERKLRQIGITHIQVPKENPESLAWAARLDWASLKAWHSASIDVLVQAPLDSSGSLIRLLKSLATADYTGFSPPRLTIELPHFIDDATLKFLNRFRWPPTNYASPEQNDQLTIRRRIFDNRLSADDASQRFVESFYPSSPKGPHVLLLSPQVELSPTYFHYLKLNVLQYRHSTISTDVEHNLFGISLESPTVHLDGNKPFQPQLTINAPPVGAEDTQPSPFCWQAPNTNAALYFGDKWMEVHSYLMKRHSAARRPDLQSHYRSEQKVVSKKSPAWAEYFLQLMRARGYFLHYPGLHLTSSLAVVHNELYQLPEEFAHLEDESKPTRDPPSTEEILTVKVDYLDSHHPSSSHPKVLNYEGPLAKSLYRVLPKLPPPSLAPDGKAEPLSRNPGALDGQVSPAATAQRLSNLPVLDHLGQPVTFDKLNADAGTVLMGFRNSAGGCSTEQSAKKTYVPLSAADMFCFDDKGDILEPLAPEANDGEMTDEFPGDGDFADPNAAPAPQVGDSPPAAEKPPRVETVPVNDGANTAPPPENDAAINAMKAAEAEKADRLREAARENNRRLEAAAQIPGEPDPAREDAKAEAPAAPAPAVPAPAPAPAPAVLGPRPGGEDPGAAVADPGAPAFPVLDASKLRAFDEGREAERDVPIPVAGTEGTPDGGQDAANGGNTAKEP